MCPPVCAALFAGAPLGGIFPTPASAGRGSPLEPTGRPFDCLANVGQSTALFATPCRRRVPNQSGRLWRGYLNTSKCWDNRGGGGGQRVESFESGWRRHVNCVYALDVLKTLSNQITDQGCVSL